MKKKLIFCLCIALSIIICFGSIPFSAYTYECDVKVTSAAVLVINTDTNTIVYDKNSNTARYASYLSNIMTYIVARANIRDLSERITITDELLNLAQNSDTSIDKFLNHTLTLKDLLHYLIMTNGTDAAHILAHYVCDGDIDAFVNLMNQKAKSLGCTKTKFSSPGGVLDASSVTTCKDMLKIYNCALDSPDFAEIAGTAVYMPEKYKNSDLEFYTNNSIMKPHSPYYFKHIKNGKYGYDRVAKGNIVVQSSYKNVKYICIIMGAQALNEHNAFTESKQLLTWTYTQLGNKEIIPGDLVLDTVQVDATWGVAEIGLVSGKDIVRTMPANFDGELLSFEFDSDSTKLKPPVFKGQSVGTGKIYYDGEFYEEINMVAESSFGVGMVDDMTSFLGVMFDSTFTQDSSNTAHDDNKKSTQPQSNTKTKPTSEPTQAETLTQAVQ